MKIIYLILIILILTSVSTLIIGTDSEKQEKLNKFLSEEKLILNKKTNQTNMTSNETIINPLNQKPNENSKTSTTSENILSSQCNQMQISYGIKNLIKKVNCTENNEEGCLLKEVKCSVEVHNYDYETSGNFKLEFSLIDTSETIIKTLETSEIINPRQNKTLKSKFILQDQEAKNINWACNYKSIEIPQKLIC
jgi:hypothetical protein